MKKIITLLMMGMLAFGIFASTTNTSTLTISATVKDITPTFQLQSSLVSSFTSHKDLDSTNDKTATLNAGEHRFINGKTDLFNGKTENDTLVVYFRLLQTESRYATDVNISMTFTRLVYAGRNGDGLTSRDGENVEGNYYTDLPVLSEIVTRPESLGLKVESFTTTATSTTPSASTDTIEYTSKLDYSIFGYFIPANTTLITFTATYNMPARDESTKYMPYGDYKGTVTVKYTTN